MGPLRYIWEWSRESGKYVTRVPIDIPTKYGRVQIPVGFFYDGASVVKNLDMMACAVHDWLYLTAKIGAFPISRKQADEIYRDLLIDKGHTILGPLRYRGLRIGGRDAWQEHRDNEMAGVDVLSQRVLKNPELYEFPTWEVSDMRLKKTA